MTRPGPWSDDTVTCLEGACFCISSRRGDVAEAGTQGLYFLDTRFLSDFSVLVNDDIPLALDVMQHDPFAAIFVTRVRPTHGAHDSTLVVERRRRVGHGLHEEIVVRNLASEAAYCRLLVSVAADFSTLQEVRAGEERPSAEVVVTVEPNTLELSAVRRRRAGRVVAPDATTVEHDGITYEVIVPARREWRTTIDVWPVVDGTAVEPFRETSGDRLDQWRRAVPAIETDHTALHAALRSSEEDLGALRVFDPEVPERAVVAAGAPWSMSLFGRDAVLTSWMALLVDPELALGVLETLARFQGTEVDPRTEEQPGRIADELPFGLRRGEDAFDPAGVSYGSIDATPLFVMLLGELRRWGLAPELVERLLPHADRALEWMRTFGDPDGDGYIEYQRATDRGRLHQGWKDSADAIRCANGELGHAPIALAEVQGYAFAAYVARAHFAREAGDNEAADGWREHAEQLRVAFNRDFWVDERGWFALGLDHDKRPLDALASNMGHCLWTGIVDEDHAPLVAERLLSPELFSGWGVRTLASTMPGYNPVSYQTGSVWPHDNAIIAAGLMRYGFVEEAQRIIAAMLDAAGWFEGRLPELFSGFDRDQFPAPVSYPSSCSPQACAAAAPLLFLRTLLRFDPWIPAGRLSLAPVLLPGNERLRIEGIPLLGGRITVEVDGDAVKVEGLPPDVHVFAEPRAPSG